MTKVKCNEESIFHICKYLKNGYCTKSEIELACHLKSDESMYHWMACEDVNEITNGMPEWKDYKDNRTEHYK